MFINSQTMGDVRQKIGTGGRFSTRFQRLVTELDTNWATLDSGQNTPYCAMALGMVAATIDPASSASGSSLVPGITYGKTKSEYSTRAMACLKAWKTANAPTYPWLTGMPIALAIDWTWSGMTAGQRSSLSTWCQTIDNAGNLNNHPGDMVNTQLGHVRASELMTGIALYGNGIVDAWASSKVANYASRFRGANGITAFDSWLAGSTSMGGDPPEGWSYGFNYQQPALLYAEEGYRTAVGGSLSTHYGSTALDTLRMLPAKMAGVMLPLGEVSGSFPGGHEFMMFAPYRTEISFRMPQPLFQWQLGAVIGRYASIDSTTAGVGQWLVENRVGEPTSDGIAFAALCTPPYILMGSSVAPTAVSPNTAYPMSYRMGESRVVLRTANGFSDTNAGFVGIDTQKWGKGAISPRQSGALVIHRKGPVITKGAVQSGNAEFSDHLTGAASHMIFPDRTVSAKQTNKDSMGGTRKIVATLVTSSTDFTNGATTDFLSTLRLQFSSGAATMQYVGQDLTRSYDSDATPDTTNNPTRVSSYWHHLVYFDPASTSDTLKLLVFDRTITKSSNFWQTDMIRFASTPIVTAASTVAGPTRIPSPTTSSNYDTVPYFSTGGTLGHVTYSSATAITSSLAASGINNKAVVTPLLPASVQVVRVGGPNGDGSSWTNNSSGYSLEATDPYGVRYVPAPIGDDWEGYLSGSYRIEITNTNPTATDNFLKAIEVGDSTITAAAVTLMNGGSNAAFFNSTGETCSTGSVVFPSSGTFRTVIAGLTPGGSYTATKGSNISDVTNLDSGSTSLSWTASTAGTMRVRIAVPTAGGGANGTVGWS
jgi:hypothetical protein